MKMAIKAVILDVGGVIITENASLAREILAKKFGFDSIKFREYVSKKLSDSYRGKLDYINFFNELVGEVGIRVTSEEMAKSWVDTRTQISRWIDVNKKLLEGLNKKYITVSLTNSTKLNDSVQIRKDVYKLFKMNIISYDVGFRKPEKKIYEIALDKLEKFGVSPSEIVFIDNKEENIIPAKELGMNTILIEDGAPIADKLKEFGVDV